MLTLVAFSLIAQNVLHVRWSCDDTGLVGISFVQVVVLCLFLGASLDLKNKIQKVRQPHQK